MIRTVPALIGLLLLGGCQGSGEPPTTAQRCSNLDMQIATTQENDGIQQDAKLQMIDGFVQQKEELGCP